jgi:hypothetical protein
MTDKQKYSIKLAINTMDKHFGRHYNTSYCNRETGISVGYGEAMNILSDMLSNTDNHACNCQHNSNSRENESCCRCDSRNTNADRIRNMSDEELTEFMQKMECSCFVDFIGYADKGCGRNEISCKDCRAKAPTILEWLQSKQNRREYER